MEIKEVTDDLSNLHHASLENMCQNFLSYRAEPVNQDSNSATTPLSLQKGKYTSIKHLVIHSTNQLINQHAQSINQPINQSTNQPINQSINQSINNIKKSMHQSLN